MGLRSGNGTQQQAEATKNWDRLKADNDAYNARTLGATQATEGAKIRAVVEGGRERVGAQKAEGDAQQKELERQKKDIDDYIRVTKATWKLVEDSVVSYKQIL